MVRTGALLLSTLVCIAQAATEHSLPTVDLGYEVHRAISYNATTETYNFTNIPYAEPPLGSLRFNAPVPPKGVKSGVQDGHEGKICPQQSPDWTLIATQFVTAWATGQLPFNLTEAEINLKNTPQPPPDPRTTEDCLVLDVVVPKAVFERKSSGRKAPVVVWIYGGGYVSGSKESWGSPNEIISASQEDGSDGIIWVAMNYRLGVFGFLAGPSLQANGTANAGLHDQRLALQWVQENIAKFGGDPENVTVMGESAGAGSIMYHLVSRGGQPVPFKRAITQSIPLSIITDPLQQESNFQDFLSILNVTSLQEARQLPSSVLIAANSKQIRAAPYDQFAFNPSVDGDLIPGPPTQLLLEGSFTQGIELLSSHASCEGALFVNPQTIGNDKALLQEFQRLFPLVPKEKFIFMVESLYPPIYDGSYPYTSDVQRAVLMTNEFFFAAAQQTLLQETIHHGTAVYAYEFAVPPAIHGSDIPYTFYDGPTPNVDASVATTIQHAIAGFAKNGMPDTRPLSIGSWPRYGSNATTLNLNVNASVVYSDITWNNRTKSWADTL
ncbi:hypothetical protein TRIATDRAFT_194942 [Trichoderma atroviride IMI 206040]|uniref:Carboxylic ester hydrolase n=1 Tax=Hypocrea atroviridis (strain ATCC 20476 / IMI 206040) TaxID=452589 RepID=G9NQK5_HYPAI|nr:uncharacterized protein TRIATDRAFT_194942 [Trichoderma atroviride IMI 206040]EHK46828.1 hypothetical protein TRIATDRAFT_194942 [Trichoderma atroviride IMI 206040]